MRKKEIISVEIYLYFSGEQSINNEQLRSAVISRDDRKYYLDLKENERGRFLRVCLLDKYVLLTSIRTYI